MQKVLCHPFPEGTRAPKVCRHTVSGSLSLPSQGCFSPFPHGTCSLSVAEEYLALRGGPRGFQQGSTCPVVLGCLSTPVQCRNAYGAVTRYGPAFQSGSSSDDQLAAHDALCNGKSHNPHTATLQRLHIYGFGLFPVRSPLLRESIIFSLPVGT